MLSLNFTKKIDIINKVTNIINSSGINNLRDELSSCEDKLFSLIENTINQNEDSVKIDALKELNPITNTLIKKYSRNLVRANANLETLLEYIEKIDIELLELNNIIDVGKHIEDLMFNVEDEKSLSKNLLLLKMSLKRYSYLYDKLNILKDLYTSLLQIKPLPKGYKDFEITFYTNDDTIDTFSSRLLSIKLLYEIILRASGLPMSEENRLIVIKSEKETIEYYKFAGVYEPISSIYFLIREWIKDFVSKNTDTDKEIVQLTNIQNMEAKIKELINKSEIDTITGEKYLDIIKKSLKSLQIEKCTSIAIYSENISIPIVSSNVEIPPQEIVKDEKKDKLISLSEKIAKQTEHDLLKKLETSILLKSTQPPIDKKSAENLLKKGITLMSIKRYDEANKYFDAAIELKPNYAEAYNYKARSYIQTSQLSEALALINKAIAFKPDYKDAYLNKGTILFSLKKLNEALEEYKKTIELDPNYAEGYFNLGSCYMMLDGMKKEAIEAFTKAIEVAVDYAQAYYNRACAYATEKEFDNCLKDLSIAIKLDKSFKNMILFDSDFNSIKENAKFKNLIK